MKIDSIVIDALHHVLMGPGADFYDTDFPLQLFQSLVGVLTECDIPREEGDKLESLCKWLLEEECK